MALTLTMTMIDHVHTQHTHTCVQTKWCPTSGGPCPATSSRLCSPGPLLPSVPSRYVLQQLGTSPSLAVCLPVCLPICLPACLYVCVSVCLCVCVSDVVWSGLIYVAVVFVWCASHISYYIKLHKYKMHTHTHTHV
jgi:hypothetical protein